MISLQQMQYILSLFEHGQFQKASEACFVSQPTLSMQIKKAEDQLGKKIFDRSKNPLQLTQFGEQLIPIIREVLRENANISRLTQQIEGKYVERIRIGMIPTISSYLVPKIVEFRSGKLSNLQLNFIELHTHQLIDKMNRGEIDLMIMAGPFSQPGYQTVKLFDEEIKAFINDAEAEEISSADLVRLRPWLLSEGNCLRSQMISFCNLTPELSADQWNYEGGNLQLLSHMVCAQGGYTLIPEYCFSNYLNTGKLASIRIEGNGHYPGRSVIGVYPNRTSFKSSLDTLLRELQQLYKRKDDRMIDVIGWQGA